MAANSNQYVVVFVYSTDNAACTLHPGIYPSSSKQRDRGINRISSFYTSAASSTKTLTSRMVLKPRLTKSMENRSSIFFFSISGPRLTRNLQNRISIFFYRI